MDYSGKDSQLNSFANNKVITRLRTFNQQSKITVQMSRLKSYESPLRKRYGVEKYELASNYVFPDSVNELIPKHTPEYVDKGENYVERIMRALHHFKQCALIGPSGTGKTHIVYLVAEIAGLPLWEINCGLQTTSFDLFGRYIGLGKENWVDGQIVSWCRQGGILYLDEANMMKQDVATRMNPLLDTRGHIVLNEKDNEIIPRHPLSYVIISLNPFSVEFAGTKPLNAAFRRRLSVWINFDYLSVGSKASENEVQLIKERGGVSEEVALQMVRVAAQLRANYKKGDLPYAPSVGDLINWGTLVADGLDLQKAAEETIVSTTSDEMATQEVVRRIIRAAASPTFTPEGQDAESLV
ncbi:MAG: CbbQ/NirQ/NorQ/GpvN family protein [Nitrososphaera sp.]|nr:CbbQ/NirQ/NorQ/GpvN family protein [Nitrososphaera sp.]